MPREELLLGVDGGGSKTVAWLAVRDTPETTRIVGRGAAGPSNPMAVGFDDALANLEEAVDAAFRDAGLARCPAAAATLGLAGSDRETVRESIEQWARGGHPAARDWQLAVRVRVVPDAMLVLAAAVGDAPGIALVSGTGSLAFGRDAQGRTARAGGWGWLLGDEGSGFALGQAALRAVVAAADGRGPATALTGVVSSALNLSGPRELVAAIHGDENPRAKIAALSPCVVQAAAAGDAVAERLVAAAAADLAALVAAVVDQLSLPARPFPLALSGGLLLGSTLLRDELALQLAARRLTADPMALVAEPVFGAVRLAERLI
jgi:N-acetylglucosamine kinase-like BadF-type ATPase